MKIIESYNDDVETSLIEVKAANYVGDFTIRVTFNDSTEKLVDFKPFLSRSVHPAISKYMNEALFKKFDIQDGNLNWNDYDLIFPVYNLYEGRID